MRLAPRARQTPTPILVKNSSPPSPAGVPVVPILPFGPAAAEQRLLGAGIDSQGRRAGWLCQ